MSLTGNGQSAFDISCSVPLPMYSQHRLEKAARCRQRAVLRRAERQDEGPQEGGIQPGVIPRLTLLCQTADQRIVASATARSATGVAPYPASHRTRCKVGQGLAWGWGEERGTTWPCECSVLASSVLVSAEAVWRWLTRCGRVSLVKRCVQGLSMGDGAGSPTLVRTLHTLHVGCGRVLACIWAPSSAARAIYKAMTDRPLLTPSGDLRSRI